MAPSPDDPDRTPPPTGSPRARSRGLRRSSRTTRWIAAAAVTGTAGLGTLYGQLLPGSTAAPAPSHAPAQHPPGSADGSGTNQQRPGADGHRTGGTATPQPTAPKPPAHPPAAGRAQPHTTTGAS
ncbi:hypothetical protein [Streptomyces sp. TR06-5]|uniref:hypothetical protein n=1 Tax=unclassified Streptomyces TaxID=2593676 RepID=UPI00399F6AF4